MSDEKLYQKISSAIVERIIEDINGRNNIGNEWRAIVEIQKEIKQEWQEIIAEELEQRL